MDLSIIVHGLRHVFRSRY